MIKNMEKIVGDVKLAGAIGALSLLLINGAKEDQFQRPAYGSLNEPNNHAQIQTPYFAKVAGYIREVI